MGIRIRQVEGENQIQQLRALLSEYVVFLRDLQKEQIDLNLLPGLQKVDAELATLQGLFTPPRGHFLVALDETRVVGCIALKPVSEHVGELKRMYVQSEYRGQQIGWRLVEKLIAEARLSGYRRIVLDSNRGMTNAHSIYKRAGFKVVPPPQEAPEALKAIVLFMELDLEVV